MQGGQGALAPAVAAGVLQTRLRLGVVAECGLVVGALRHRLLERGELLLDRNQLTGATQDVLAQGEIEIARRPLVVERDLDVLGQHELAEVGRGLAGQHPQQGGLARAVAAGQGHPVAALELERDAAQQRLARDVLAEIRCDYYGHGFDGMRAGSLRSPRMPSPLWPPVPPIDMPPARTVTVPGRGELFLRDSGNPTHPNPTHPGDGAAVMLLHGWMATADLNWCGSYGDLAGAGYRVLAIDHRGHGRGLRQVAPFRLVDCAGDAAAALRELGVAPALVVGYSMGGAIAQLMVRDFPDVVAGLVLSGTAQHWQDPQTRRVFKAMGALGLMLSVAPLWTWTAGFRRVGLPDSPETAWALSEVMRHSARHIAEAGRELGRFDSRPWLKPLPVPSAVVLTTRDDAVAPAKQRALAAALGAPIFEAPISHMQITTSPAAYNPALLRALATVAGRETVAAA